MVYLTSLIVFVSEKVCCTTVLGAAMYFVYLQAKHNPLYSASFFWNYKENNLQVLTTY